MSYRIDARRISLLEPGLGAPFFASGRPAQEELLAAEMSRIVYAKFAGPIDGGRTLIETLQRIGFDRVDLIHRHDTQALVATDSAAGLTMVSFRGTDTEGLDLVTDVRIRMVDWPGGGRVHEGFAAALGLVWADVEASLAQAGTGHRTVYTGHSLGAALATLAASRRKPAAVVAFGSPRVGDRTFCASLAGTPFQRFINCCDMVCRLPPEEIAYGHVTAGIPISGDGAFLPADGPGAIRSDRLRARLAYTVRHSWRPGTVWTRDLADHTPVNYVSALASALGERSPADSV